jgi:CRISPR/Cas system CSM-associated protein Csm4 (group 5 of RAMP superfamily)
VVTFPFANDGSNRSYSMISVAEGHHELSHHQNDPKKHEKIKRINKFHIEQLAYLLTKLQSVKENGKSLLDQSLIVYGSGIGDGNRHNHDDLPILLAGHGGGKIKGGRHLKFAKDTPLMNLYLAMFQTMGCPTKSFGDSTGVLPI